jgi:hypothetical protein
MYMLRYLLGIAQGTEGTGVWRALFAELYCKLKKDLEAVNNQPSA